MMDSRERLRRCYFHEELDRPGVYSRTGFPADDPTYDRLKAYLQEYTDLKLGWNGRVFETLYSAQHLSERHSEDFERHITKLSTPKGELRSTYLHSLKGQPGMQEKYLLETPEDVEKYLSLPFPEISGDVSSFFEVEKAIGDRGIVDVGLGLNPGGFAASLFGSTNFAIISITHRDLIHLLCERQMNIVLQNVKFLLENGVGPFFSMLGEEYIVPPLHGPADFYDFNVKYDKPIIDLIHNADGRIHIHCHGSIKKILRGFIEIGADVLHPLEAPPMGDIEPGEAKEIIRDKITFEGNIQIADMYECSPEAIREKVSVLIRSAFDDHKGLIVCPTASPYIRGKGEECFPQYKVMIDTVLQWKD